MTYDSWKTPEPEPDYAPDEEPPCEMGETLEPVWDVVIGKISEAIAWANLLCLHATITLRITSLVGSVVDVTKQSEMARRGR